MNENSFTMCPNFIYWILQVLKALKASKSLINQELLACLFDSNYDRYSHTELPERLLYTIWVLHAPINSVNLTYFFDQHIYLTYNVLNLFVLEKREIEE